MYNYIFDHLKAGWGGHFKEVQLLDIFKSSFDACLKNISKSDHVGVEVVVLTDSEVFVEISFRPFK